MSDDDEVGTVWLRTTPDENGTYRPTLEIDDDTSIFMDRKTATAHAQYVMAVCASAVIQAKMFKQLTSVIPGEKGQAGAAQIVVDFRQEVTIPDPPTPLSLRAAINPQGTPFFVVSVKGVEVGQWDLDGAHAHALHCLMLPFGADNDSAYLRVLRGIVGVDENIARSMIADMAEIDV